VNRPLEMRVDQEQIDAYADLSHDHNVLHTDPVRAAQSSFGGVIAHGFIPLLPALEVLRLENGEHLHGVRLSARWVAPTRPGELVTCVSAAADATLEPEGEPWSYSCEVDGVAVVTGGASRLDPEAETA
jgi:acyl dehydratase